MGFSSPQGSLASAAISGVSIGASDLSLLRQAANFLRVSDGSGGVANLCVANAALATSATKGFIYIGSCAGTPTGVPATIPTGQIPVVWDSSNNLLYAYDGGWIQVGGGGGGKAVLAWGGLLPNSAVTRYLLRYYYGTPTSALTTLDYSGKIIAPFDGTVRNLYVEFDSAYVVSTTFTVQKNGLAQSVTVASGTSATKVSDTSNSFSVSAGDELSIKWVGDTACGSRVGNVTLELAAS